MLNASFVPAERKNKVVRYFTFVWSVIFILLLSGGCERKNNTDHLLSLENPLLNDLKIKNGTSFQRGSYTISLEDGLYEQSTQLGLLIFKVTNAKGSVEAEITSSNQLVGERFGKDGRFTISIMKTHSQTVSAKYEGNDLFITYKFELHDDNPHLNDCICLTDRNMSSENAEPDKGYFFSLDTIERSKQIQMGEEGTIYISSMGYRIVSERKYSINSMEIILSDGTKINIIDEENDIGDFGSCSVGEKTLFVFNRFFDEWMDCSKIDTLLYNGNSYKVSGLTSKEIALLNAESQ